MFSYFGIEKEKVALLKDAWAIHVPFDGRINIAGINTKNLDYVADALIEVLK
jgi:aromatic-amino-acid transaminase